MPTLSVTSDVGKFHTWTKTGVECYSSGADCDNCAVYQAFQFRKDNPKRRCHQPESNAQLLGNGVQPPETDEELTFQRSVPGAYVAFGRGRILEQVGEKLRAKIVSLIPTLEYPSPISLVKELNKENFLGASWDHMLISNHMARMRKFGVIGYTEVQPRRQSIYHVLDVSRLEDMKRKPPKKYSIHGERRPGGKFNEYAK
jgi:hypothetical protein